MRSIIMAAQEKQRYDEMPVQFLLDNLNGHDLYEATVADLRHHLLAGSFTSVEYVKFCLERIRKVGRCLSSTPSQRVAEFGLLLVEERP